MIINIKSSQTRIWHLRLGSDRLRSESESACWWWGPSEVTLSIPRMRSKGRSMRRKGGLCMYFQSQFIWTFKSSTAGRLGRIRMKDAIEVEEEEHSIYLRYTCVRCVCRSGCRWCVCQPEWSVCQWCVSARVVCLSLVRVDWWRGNMLCIGHVHVRGGVGGVCSNCEEQNQPKPLMSFKFHSSPFLGSRNW